MLIWAQVVAIVVKIIFLIVVIFQFDCAPPVVNVAHASVLDHYLAMFPLERPRMLIRSQVVG